MSRMKLLWKYFNYLIFSSTKYDVHSPFLFEFIDSVLNSERQYYAFSHIEILRKNLLADNGKIRVEDFGAGSKKNKTIERRVCDIAKNTLITPKSGQFLFRMADHYQCNKILELGTSLGISTLYLAKAVEHAEIVTLEGSKEIAAIAERNFTTMRAENIKLLTGEFSQTLPLAFQLLKNIDLAFIDGNHRKDPTLDYYSRIIQFTNENSILVFDDIHWSDEMEEAWNIIKSYDEVTLSIDLFFKGIVFFRKDFHEKQHFVIRF
ncbi:MAG: O-methyltransferase [Chitinophagales bacterium]